MSTLVSLALAGVVALAGGCFASMKYSKEKSLKYSIAISLIGGIVGYIGGLPVAFLLSQVISDGLYGFYIVRFIDIGLFLFSILMAGVCAFLVVRSYPDANES